MALIVNVGTKACAIPLADVAETMRPLAIEVVAGTPSFILGVSVIRGAPIPIVDLRVLLDGEHSASFSRFVTLKVGERGIAVGVASIVGLRPLDSTQLDQLPPLLRDVRTDFIAAIGSLDAQLLVVLRAARIVPAELWASLTEEAEVSQ